MSVSEVKKKEFTLDEVKKHTTAEDCWLIIGNASNGAFIHVTSISAAFCPFLLCVLPKLIIEMSRTHTLALL